MKVMFAHIAALVLIVIALVAGTLHRAYFYLSAKELKHRAMHGDDISVALYEVAAYGAEAQLLLIVLLLLAAACGLVLLAQVAPAPIDVVVTIFVLMFGIFWQPHARLTKFDTKLAVWLAPTTSWLTKTLHPLLWPFVSWAKGLRIYQRHTKLFDAADFDALLERQRQQRDSRLDEATVERMQRGLRFNVKRVGEVMTPRSKVRAVNSTDPLTPILVDELHKTGHARFPVYEGKQNNVVGTLAMDAIADIKLNGTVGDHSEHRVAYLHEEDTLQRALEAFYATHQYLFIVVNHKGTYAGILTLEDVFRELAGEPKQTSAGQYEDRGAVLARHARKEKS